MTSTTMIQQWGNSRAVRIPKQLANELGLAIGQRVELAAANGQLVIRPARRRSRYKLVTKYYPQQIEMATPHKT